VPPSLISNDLVIAGDLEGQGEVQIDGTINGNISGNTLLIGVSANITGDIIAETVRVHGTVNGQIKARSVSLARTAHVVGNILHENLSVELGAFLEGHCKHINSKKKGAEAPVSLMVKSAYEANTAVKLAVEGKDPVDPKKVAASS